MKFGERFSELRRDKGLKQKDVAMLLNIAVSTVSNYETDTHEPDLENLCKLADLFGVSTDYLLGRTNIKTDINSLNEPVSASMTRADIIEMMEQFSKEDCAHMVKTLRLLYYYGAKKDDVKEI